MWKRSVILGLYCASVACGADSPIERWAKAMGGRDKLASISAIYREGALEFAGQQGSIKVWHTAEGKYRKEEKLGPLSGIEVCDGLNVFLQQGNAAPRQLAGEELAVEKSKAFANSNALFFVFFPDRHQGSRDEAGNTITFKPSGGIEWRVVLDPETFLPKEMIHQEGGRTISAALGAYQTIDGLKLETEVRRSAGDPNKSAIIRFTKTIINPPLDGSLFSASSAPNDKSSRATQIVSQIRRADYEGNRAELQQCYDALASFMDDDELAVRIRYWRGFALWRSAINGFNDGIDQKTKG